MTKTPTFGSKTYREVVFGNGVYLGYQTSDVKKGFMSFNNGSDEIKTFSNRENWKEECWKQFISISNNKMLKRIANVKV